MKEDSHIINPTELFRAARDQAIGRAKCFSHSVDWPRVSQFNWALDWFDQVSAAERCAVIVAGEYETQTSYAELRDYSNRIANYFRQRGAKPEERLLVMMHNSIEYYAVVLAGMKLGLPIVPLFPNLQLAEVEDRINLGRIRHIVVDVGALPALRQINVQGLRITAGGPSPDWLPLSEANGCSERFIPTRRTKPEDILLGYFTSGTTSRPKLVWHSHRSYPVGHLSSLFWQGIGPGDVHACVSSPGWAKHAWSSLFVPFGAEATALVFARDRPDPRHCLTALRQHGVTSFCAPPSYWRALVQDTLGRKPASLRQVVSAGEPLDDRISDEVLRNWGLRIRNGYGQTETTAMIGFAPGQEVVSGGLGYPLPGYSPQLIDPVTHEPGDEGEICLDLNEHNIGLMLGYADAVGTPRLPPGRYYRTGDLAKRDSRGCFHLTGRTDDVFKSYDIRISPIEIERALRRHPQVRDVAVFAVPDKRGNLVPAAAFVAADSARDQEMAMSLLLWQQENLSERNRVAHFWAVRELPKTLSGKTNRAALRERFAVEPLKDSFLRSSKEHCEENYES